MKPTTVFVIESVEPAVGIGKGMALVVGTTQHCIRKIFCIKIFKKLPDQEKITKSLRMKKYKLKMFSSFLFFVIASHTEIKAS